MNANISLTELKQSLSEKSKAELIEEIALLYKKFPIVKEYYQAAFSSNNSAVLDKYKDIVKGEFLISRHQFPKMRFSVARKAISDFKKISTSKQDVADIMLTYVEAGVACTQEFGDIDEPFYNSMESMYETVLKYVVKENLFDEFDRRLKRIVTNTSNTGWGFHEQLAYLYEEYQAKQPDTQVF